MLAMGCNSQACTVCCSPNRRCRGTACLGLSYQHGGHIKYLTCKAHESPCWGTHSYDKCTLVDPRGQRGGGTHARSTPERHCCLQSCELQHPHSQLHLPRPCLHATDTLCPAVCCCPLATLQRPLPQLQRQQKQQTTQQQTQTPQQQQRRTWVSLGV